MSSSKSVGPISLQLQPSRYLLGFAVTTHLVAFSALLLVPLPIAVLVIFVMFVSASMGFHLACMGWLSVSIQRRCWYGCQVNKLTWKTDGQWLLITTNGLSRKASLLPTTVVFPWLVSLHLKLHEVPWYRSRIQILLLPDMMGKENFRRLRVRLRVESIVAEDS